MDTLRPQNPSQLVPLFNLCYNLWHIPLRTPGIAKVVVTHGWELTLTASPCSLAQNHKEATFLWLREQIGQQFEDEVLECVNHHSKHPEGFPVAQRVLRKSGTCAFPQRAPLNITLNITREPLACNLRLNDVAERVVFFVDGEQTGIGYLGVLVNGDPRKRRRQQVAGRGSTPPPSLNSALQGRLKSMLFLEAFLKLFIP